MDKKYDAVINEWIEENKDEIISEWTRLCKIPAIKGEAKENAPFGEDCAKGLEECTKMFEKRGYDAKIYSDDGYSLVESGKGEKTIGIFAHSDVVPVGEGWIFTQPFDPIVKDGVLIGRGVQDNKSGVMASLCAMEIIKKYNIPIKSRLQLFIGSNEESGMKDIEAFAKNQPMPDISIIPDANFPCGIGEKGICHMYAKSDAKLLGIVDFCGGEAFNVVLDKAEVKIKKTDKLSAEIDEKLKSEENITKREENEFVVLVGKGVAKHASMPENSVNAAYVLASFLSNIEALDENERKVMRSAAHILSCPFGTSLGIDFCDDLFGKLTFANGMVKLQDGKLWLSFDMRYSSALNSEDLLKRTENALKTLEWGMEIKENKPGFSIDESSKIPALFEEAFYAVTGFERKGFRMGGGTYARYLKNAFSIGTYAKTTDSAPLAFEMPAGHGGPHQCDEMIVLDEFFTAVKIMVYYLIAADEDINRI